MKLRFFIATILAASFGCGVMAAGEPSPKREFRGAWLHTIFQGQYKRQTTEQNKEYLIRQLDSLQAAGVNAVLWQVRPQSDALYPSELEPWSRFLTDNGAAPEPMWDPLEFMIEQCHNRGMELHAWLNPYRVTSNKNQTLPPSHIYHRHPERFLRYDGKLYFDPALPENREFIGQVVDDIVARYDVDGIHFDDYFYPYPVAGKEFPDDESYVRYGNGMDRGDWRRHNVDMLIESLNTRIHAAKPWVRFGVSPFGIWRNKSTDPRGSNTGGLQNYDALYADVLLWEQNGWIDYQLPQLYWELDHRTASTRELVQWWNEHSGSERHLYIGQDVNKCMDKNELGEKVDYSRRGSNIKGNCWWPGYSVTRNYGGSFDSLTVIQATVALPPEYPWLDSTRPAAVEDCSIAADGTITWNVAASRGEASDATRFVVYRFDNINDIDLTNPEAVVSVQPGTGYRAEVPGVYVVTSLSRTNIESEPSVPVVVRVSQSDVISFIL